MTTAARSSFWKPRSHGQVAVQPHPLRWGERRHGAADAHYEPALIAPSGGDRTLINTWDADSNRVGMNANGTAYAFVYDTTAGIPAVLEESTSGSTVYYIREPGGSLLARLNSSDGIRYYHFDELGSTRLLTDGSGTVTDRYAYDAYGSVLSHDCYSGSVSQPYQYVGQLGYYTHWMEPEFGLLQLGVRFYDPEVGRFTQRDPLAYGSTGSPYAYSDGNPAAYVDPSGLRCTLVSSQLIPGIYARKYLRSTYGSRDRQVGSVLYPRGINCFCVCVKQPTRTDIYQVRHDYLNTYSCQYWTKCGYGKPVREQRIESVYDEESETKDMPGIGTGKTYWVNGIRVGDDCGCPGVKP